MSDRTPLDNIEAVIVPTLSVVFVCGVVILTYDEERPSQAYEESEYTVLEERYSVLEERYTALETLLGHREVRLEACMRLLERPLDVRYRPLEDAGDAREERVSGVDIVPEDASRVPLAPPLGGGYKWGNRVKLDLQTPERNPDEGTFRVGMTPNQDGIAVEYRVGL